MSAETMITKESLDELYDSIETMDITGIVNTLMRITPLRDEITRRITPIQPTRKRRTQAEMGFSAISRQPSAFSPVSRRTPAICNKRKSRKQGVPCKLDSLLQKKFPFAKGNFGYTEKPIVHPSQRSILELSPPTPAPTNSSHNASMSHVTPGVISPSPSEHSERQEKTNSLSAVNPFLSMPELSQGLMNHTFQFPYWNPLAMLSTHFPYNAMMMMQPQFSTKAEVQGGTLSPPSSKATSAVSPQSIANMEEEQEGQHDDDTVEVVDPVEESSSSTKPDQLFYEGDISVTDNMLPLTSGGDECKPLDSPKEIQCTDCEQMVLLQEYNHHIQAQCTRNIKKALESSHPLTSGDWESCSVCSETVPALEMITHIKLRHSVRDDSFTCHICHQIFKNKSTLKRHKITHSASGGYACGWCGKIFAKPELLRRHELIHTETTKTLWPCPKCGKGFSNKYNLAVHDRMHTGEKPFTCPNCPETFRVKCSMQNHMKSKHPEAYYLELSTHSQTKEV